MMSQPNEPSAELVAEIRDRLGRVCGKYSDQEFSDLVRQIAIVRAKYDALRAESFFNAATLLAAERLSIRSRPVDQPIGPPS
jgi:hypothetical protein